MICFLTTDTAGEGIFRAGFLSKGRGKRRNNTILLCRHDGQNLLIFVSSFMWFMFFSGRCLEFDFFVHQHGFTRSTSQHTFISSPHRLPSDVTCFFLYGKE